MQIVESLDDYYSIIKRRKAELGRLGTNNYMFPRAIGRYIYLKRLYYETIESGIVFYPDEERYYQAYYYIAEDEDVPDLTIENKDKPVLVQHIYRENAKGRLMQRVERSLQKSGFEQKGVSRHAVLQQAEKIYKTVERSMQRIQKLLDQEGFV